MEKAKLQLFIICGLVLFLVTTLKADWNDFTYRGYVRETPIVWKPSPLYSTFGNDDYRFDNLLHSRLNLRWYPAGNFTFGVELKTKLYLGDSAGEMKQAAESFKVQEPYFDWSRNFIEEDKTVWSGTVDRCWLDWYRGDFQITVGRQRIAWGTNLVWNPMDLFNPSNPLDFDNEEMPGADGVRIQHYLGPNSKMEFAFTPGKDDFEESAYAGKLMLNAWQYDFHFLAGRKFLETVIGFAWAGDIKGGGFTGELLYSVPSDTRQIYVSPLYSFNVNDEPYLTASVAGDYTFRNTLFLQGAFLYNGRGTEGDAGGMALIQSLLRGDLTPAKWSLFLEAAKDLHPLVRADLMGIVNPNDKSCYLGPSLSWSVVTNLDLTAMGLIFGGDEGTEFGDNSDMLMLRLKWSF